MFGKASVWGGREGRTLGDPWRWGLGEPGGCTESRQEEDCLAPLGDEHSAGPFLALSPAQ